MKKLLTLVIIIGCAAFPPVQAQDAQRGMMAKRMTDSMTVQLGLTGEQASKVLAINEAFARKATEIRNEGGSKPDRLKKLKAANGDRNKALKAVLTEEQFKTFKANRKENHANAKERYKQLKEG